MKNPEWSIYTYRHRRAFLYTVEKLLKEGSIKDEMRKRAMIHDLDKLLLYQFLDVKKSQHYHIYNQSHHLESGKCNDYLDMLEMVIDLESAPLTKPDKPLNAYNFVNLLLDKGYIEREFYDKLITIMEELDIAKSYELVMDEEVGKYIGDEDSITEEMILLEIINYVRNNSCPELEYINSQCYLETGIEK